MTEQRETPEPGAGGTGERLIAIVESILFACGEPITLARLAEIVPEAGRDEIRAALGEVARRCEQEGRGIRLVEVANAYQLRTAPEHGEWVRRLFQQRPWRLTRATLETLAIVAYRQPITRAEIEAIRGVDVDSVLVSLLARKLIRIAGRKEAIGRPLLYGTTRQFLEVFGLKDLASLPALSEVAPPATGGVAAGAASAGEDTWSGDDTGGGVTGHSAPEAAGAGGDLLAPDGGVPDRGGSGTSERTDGDGAGGPSSTD